MLHLHVGVFSLLGHPSLEEVCVRRGYVRRILLGMLLSPLVSVSLFVQDAELS